MSRRETECGFFFFLAAKHNVVTCTNTLTQWHFPTTPWCAPQQPFCTNHWAQLQCQNTTTTTTNSPCLPHYDLPHHLLYHTLYGAEPFSQAANNTAFQGCESFCLFFCFPAAEHHIWCCICLMATALPPAQPPSPSLSLSLSHFFSLNPSFLLYHSFLLLCSERGRGGEGRGGEGCAGLHVWLCTFLRRETAIQWQLRSRWTLFVWQMTGGSTGKQKKKKDRDKGKYKNVDRERDREDDEWYEERAQTSACLLSTTARPPSCKTISLPPSCIQAEKQ